MKNISILLFSTVTLFGCNSIPDQPTVSVSKEQMSKEPPLRYHLRIDGEDRLLEEGEALRVFGKFHDPEVAISLDPYREFKGAGISFLYPNQFVFKVLNEESNSIKYEFEKEKFRIWIELLLDGDFSPELMADKFRSLYESQGVECHLSEEYFEMDDTKLLGIRLKSKIYLDTITYEENMEIFRLPAKRGSLLLILVDGGLAGELPTETYREVVTLLGKSLNINY